MTALLTASPRSTIRFGVFDVDLTSRELYREGHKVPLQDQPFQVLEMLLERPGSLVTREEMRHRLWPATEAGEFDIGLNKAVAKLRDALHDDASAPRYIETLPKRGYRFIAGVAEPQAPQPTRRFSKAWLVVPLIVAALAIGAFAVRSRLTHSRAVVAVLPFRSLSAGQDYLGDALTIELISTLSRAHPSQLGVIAPTSVMAYRNSSLPLRAIASQLNAQYVVEGTVQRAESWVRITARLTRADDQTQVWANTFDRQDGDAFQIQSDVAEAIARAVRVRIAPQQFETMRPTRNQDAYDEYLKGLSLEQTHANAEEAIQHYERAVHLDPNFARAWVGIAECSPFIRPREVSMPRGEAAARQAIALDPNLPVAHAAMGTIQMVWHWNWAAADAEFSRAISVQPAEPETLTRYAQYLAARGRLDEAIVAARRASEQDPRSPLILQQLGRYYYFNHQPENAIYEWNKSLEIDPKFWWSHLFLSIVARDRHDYKTWFEHRVRAMELAGAPRPFLDRIEAEAAKNGYEQMSRTMLHFQEEAARHGGVDSMTLAIENAKLGNTDAAFDWMDRALDGHPNDAIYLNVEPGFDSIRTDPRFQQRVRRVGL